MTTDAPAFSIIVPLYNEQDGVDDLIATIEVAMQPVTTDYEILLVDDGSTDETLDRLKRHAAANRRVRIFSFRRNLGKSPALTCGFQRARGRYVVTMDADLQDDPHDIKRMYAHLQQARVSMVSGWRKDRNDSLLKVVSSKIFNLIVVRMLFGVTFKDMNSGLKLYEVDVARDLHLYGGMHRFIPLIATEMGYRVAELPVTHHERKYGTSKYSPMKIFTEIPDLLTLFFLIKYTRKPLHFFGRIGATLSILGFAILSYLTWLWTQSISIGTRPLLTFGVLLVLVGGQIVFTGLLADLIVNVNQARTQEFPLRYASDRTVAHATELVSD
jgi:glycosyltransferase involved in cell wall biosynthesis